MEHYIGLGNSNNPHHFGVVTESGVEDPGRRMVPIVTAGVATSSRRRRQVLTPFYKQQMPACVQANACCGAGHFTSDTGQPSKPTKHDQVLPCGQLLHQELPHHLRTMTRLFQKSIRQPYCRRASPSLQTTPGLDRSAVQLLHMLACYSILPRA